MKAAQNKNNINELISPEDYVALQKIAIKYLSKAEIDSCFNQLLKVVEDEFLKIIPEAAGLISRCSDEQQIAKILEDAYKKAFAEIEVQLDKLAENDWRFLIVGAGFLNRKISESDIYLTWLAYQAMYSKEAEYCVVMKREIVNILKCEQSIPKSVGNWLSYVLSSVTVPHNSKGAPIRNRAKMERHYKLAHFILDNRDDGQSTKIVQLLKAAALKFSVTYETVRGDYYNNDFKILLKFLSEKKTVK